MRAVRRVVVPVLCAVAIGGAAPALAQEGTMYSWTDENGVVHFSDRAPAGRDLQAQPLPESPPPGSVSPQPADSAEPSAAQQRREEIARNSAEARAQRERQAAECDALKVELARLEPNRRVFFTNEEGETERMDDVERTDRVAELRDLISNNCP